jgi:hypothetical protein
MSNAKRYVIESLAATGFAILRGSIAFRLRPDLWATGSDAGYDFIPATLTNRLSGIEGVQTFLTRFKEIDEGSRFITVLARSGDDLARRIHLITGFTPELLIPESQMEGQVDLDAIPSRKVFNAATVSDDVHAGVVTKEPGRQCNGCEWMTAGLGCTNSDESGIKYPTLNLLRRCRGYRPTFESYDQRVGATLWPELFVKA